MVEIVPAIIPNKFEDIEEKLVLVKDLVKKVQIDVVDGKYVGVAIWPFVENNSPKNISQNSFLVLPYKNDVVLELDMMVKNPEDYMEDFIKMGFRSFVVHVDSTEYLEKCIHLAQESQCKVGLGIRPYLDTKVLEKYLDRIDFVQFMGNDNVGHNGVELDRRVLDKIYHFHSSFPFVPIQVDIGVNDKTIEKLASVGVTSFVSGSAVFGLTSSPQVPLKQVEENIKNLLKF